MLRVVSIEPNSDQRITFAGFKQTRCFVENANISEGILLGSRKS